MFGQVVTKVLWINRYFEFEFFDKFFRKAKVTVCFLLVLFVCVFKYTCKVICYWEWSWGSAIGFCPLMLLCLGVKVCCGLKSYSLRLVVFFFVICKDILVICACDPHLEGLLFFCLMWCFSTCLGRKVFRLFSGFVCAPWVRWNLCPLVFPFWKLKISRICGLYQLY